MNPQPKGVTQNVQAEQNNTILDITELRQLADSFLSVGDLDRAQDAYEKAAVLDPDAPDPYVGLAAVALRKNRLDDARLAFRVACRLDPRCPKAWEGLGRVAQQNEDYETAFEMYLRCLELDTNNLIALLGLFQASSQMGSFAKIIHYLEVYLNMHPDDTAVMFSLATLYIKEDRYENAQAMLLKIRSISPENKDVENLLEEVRQNITRDASQ
jgi:tetratricopeptide (TPR) repeat protein